MFAEFFLIYNGIDDETNDHIADNIGLAIRLIIVYC